MENNSMENVSVEELLIDYYKDLNIFERHKYIIIPVAFGVIFLVGFIGNAVLIATILLNPVMRTVPNIFIVSTAIGDILLLLVSVPTRAVTYAFERLVFNEFYCKSSEYMITCSLAVSIFTLTAMAVDRFITIVYPMTALTWSTMQKTLLVVTCIWVISIAVAIPDLVTPKVITRTFDNKSLEYCELYGVDTPLDEYWYYHFRPIFHFLFFFLLHLIAIGAMYVAIAHTLYRSNLVAASYIRDSAHANVACNWRKQARSRRRVARMVLLMVVLFAACWLPRYVYIFAFRVNGEMTEALSVLKIIGLCLSFAYSCINPITLYFFSVEFRHFFNHYICGLCCKDKWLSRVKRWSEADQTVTASID